MLIIYEARWPNCHQVMASWRSFGPAYDSRRVTELESRGFVVKRLELKA